MSNSIEKYINITDKILFTIVCYDLPLEDFKSKLQHQMNIIKTKKDSYKRNLYNSRLFNLMKLVTTETKFENLEHIFYIGAEVNYEKLSSDDLKMLREYNINKFYYGYGKTFDCEYLAKLFFDFKFFNVATIIKNTIKLININDTKEKNVEDKSFSNPKELSDILSKYGSGLLITNNYQTSLLSPNISNNWILLKQNVPKKDLLFEFDKKDQIEFQNNVLKIQNMLSNPKECNLVAVGDFEKIKEMIVDCSLKEFYISDIMFNKLESEINVNDINCKYGVVKQINKNDNYDGFVKNYNGFIGLFYY